MPDETVSGSGWSAAKKVAEQVSHHWWAVSGRRVLSLVVLSRAPYWYVGHYWRSRMDRCRGVGCEACAAGCGKQVRYVFCAAERSTRRVGLLEVGEYVAETIHALEGRHNGLQYMCIEMAKHTTANRSRMEVTYLDEDPGSAFLDLVPSDPAGALKRTWEAMDKERGVRPAKLAPIGPGKPANAAPTGLAKPPKWKP